MAKFLLTVWPFPGHVHPNLALAEALRSLGHEPAFYTGQQVRDPVEGEGFHYFPFQHVDSGEVEAMILRLGGLAGGWRRPLQQKALLRAWLLGTVPGQLADLESIAVDWRPEVIVSDPAMWGPILVLSERHRIPLAVFSYLAACILPGPDGPIVGLPLPRARTWYARLGRRVLRAAVGLAARDVRRSASGLRQAYGLPPLETNVTAFTGQAPLYLVASSREFDYQRRDLPASVHYVGPCLWSGAAQVPPPAWLTELAGDVPLIYVTEGTTHVREPFVLRAALQGLADLPVRVIATTGRHRDPSALGLDRIPNNARLEQWAPHHEVFRRAALVVTTGGSGTVLGALKEGVPLLVVPTTWDQPENAWRVAEAGAGLHLAPRQCTPAAMRSAVLRMLRDGSFRHNAQRLAGDFARDGGPARAAELVEGLALHATNVEAVSARGWR